MGDPGFENHSDVAFVQGNHEIQAFPSRTPEFSGIARLNNSHPPLYVSIWEMIGPTRYFCEESNVLTVLSKGTIVELSFELLDADDHWTLVRVPTLNIFGFVQTRNLATPSLEAILR